MSDIRKNDERAETPKKETGPISRADYKFVPPVVEDEEFYEDEYGDFESFEKMPKGRKKNEWY